MKLLNGGDMAVNSTMRELGTSAPDFDLLDTVTGENVSLDSVKSDKATAVMFICNHCPYVKHVNEAVVKLSDEYSAKGVSFVGISANDVAEYPEDSPENMKEYAQKLGYKFPYLYDESQEVARAYGAACTPDFFVYDGDLKLAYRGRMDGSSPGNDIPNTGEDLRSALDAMLAGETPNPEQHPSMGCSIKWKV
jgi:peroxiredoxin